MDSTLGDELAAQASVYGSATVEQSGERWCVDVQRRCRSCRTQPSQGMFVTTFRWQDEILGHRRFDEAGTLEAIRLWLSGSIDEYGIYRALPRLPDPDALMSIRGRLLELLELDVPVHVVPPKLWIERDERSCTVVPVFASAGHATLELRIEDTRVADIGDAAVERLVRVIPNWLKGMGLRELKVRHPDAVVLPHAQRFENGDIAGFRWATMLDSAAWGDRPLGPHEPLLREIIDRPVASTFFAFTSLDTLCFSACTHWPFDIMGLPQVSSNAAGEVTGCCNGREDDTVKGTPKQIADWIERKLTESGRLPVYGTAVVTRVEPINAALAACASDLRVVAAREMKHWHIYVDQEPAVRVSWRGLGARDFCSVHVRDSTMGTSVSTAQEAAERIIDFVRLRPFDELR